MLYEKKIIHLLVKNIQNHINFKTSYIKELRGR